VGLHGGDALPPFWRDVTAQALASMENKTVEIECDAKIYSMFVAPVVEAGYVNLYGQDITERKRNESLINDLRTFNETVLNNSPIGILTYKITGQCVYVNQHAASIVGAEVDQLKRQNVHEIASWKSSGLYDFVQKAIATRAPATSDFHHNSTFGKDVWLAVSCVIFESKMEPSLMPSLAYWTRAFRSAGILPSQSWKGASPPPFYCPD
jgi:PAS domain S-box-containing protein